MKRRPEQVDRFRGKALVAEYRKVAWSTRIDVRVRVLLAARRRRVLAEVRRHVGRDAHLAGLAASAGLTDPFETDTWDQDVEAEVEPEAAGVYADISTAGYELFNPVDAKGLLSEIDTTPHLRSLVGRMQGLGPDTARDIGGVLNADFAQGLAYPKIAEDVGEVFDTSDSRAMMIARTEISRGVEDINGAYASVLDGVGMRMTKSWMPAEDPCEECAELGLEGAVYIDDAFSTGDRQPPDPHPNCRCSLAYDTVQNQPVGS